MWDAGDPTLKEKSLDQEHRLAKELSFRVQKGSGNQPWPSMKADGTHPSFLFELKRTKASRIAVGQSVVAKIVSEARRVGKEPVLVFTIEGLEDPLPRDWAVIPVDVLKALIENM